MSTNDNTQFTLSLKEYLDDKFKVISQRIDSLAGSIDSLIHDTSATKERVSALETRLMRIEEDIKTFKGVFRMHMRAIVVAFLVGTLLWVPSMRMFIWSILQKYLGL